jgi:hypothetical protein
MKIIEDFLPKWEFFKLQEAIMSEHFPWFYTNLVSLPAEHDYIDDALCRETDGLTHVVYDRRDDVRSFTFDYFISFLNRLSSTLGYTEPKLLKLRLGMKMPKIGYTEENYNLPHVDHFFPNKTLIYYLNDCDGDTRMFDQMFVPGNPPPSKFTTQRRITPKANTLIEFDGLQYHTASNPLTSARRVVLNISFEE